MAARVLSLVAALLLGFTVGINTAERYSKTARNNVAVRIFDGKPAKVGDLPHQAYILAEKAEKKETRVCGGSLIRENAVLTEEWCVTNYQKWTIRLGGIYRSGNELTAWTTVSPWAMVHPGFNRTTYYANLAVIFLVHNAPLSGFIMPVPLATCLEDDHQLQHGVISGWGATNVDGDPVEVLQWTEVMILADEICKEFYPNRYTADKLCAGNEDVGGYWGDDGTGLHVRTPYGFKQIGILISHHGSAPRNRTLPSLYTRVAYFIEWINVKVNVSRYSCDV